MDAPRHIWKFPLKLPAAPAVVHTLTLEVPRGARPLCIMTQRGRPHLWAEVHTHMELVPLVVQCVSTGHGAVPENGEYLDSCVDGYDLVWHVYLIKDAAPPRSDQ